MKLIDVQKKLKAPKSQYNSFGKYSYRNAEDILEALKPILEDAVVTVTDDVVLIGERYYVKATATFKGEDEHSVSAFAREASDKKGMDEAQITGAASSYARKYALNGLFLIDDTKDADTTNTHGKESTATLVPTTREEVIDVTDTPSRSFVLGKKKVLEATDIDTLESFREKTKNSDKLSESEKNELLDIIDSRISVIIS